MTVLIHAAAGLVPKKGAGRVVVIRGHSAADSPGSRRRVRTLTPLTSPRHGRPSPALPERNRGLNSHGKAAP